MTRLGLIGAGPWGRNYIRTIARMSDVRLQMVASQNPTTVRLVPTALVVADWVELLDDPELDGVIVCSPPGTHAEIARRAINAGLPVLVEKPLALDTAAADDLVVATSLRDSIVFVNHIYLFHPAFVRLMTVARGHNIHTLESVGGNAGPFRADTPPLWDYGPHDVAMCLAIAGSAPDQIEARSLRRSARPEGDGEIVEIDLTWSSGLRGRIVVGNLMEERARHFVVQGDTWSLDFDDTRQEKLLERRGAGVTPVAVEDTPALESVVREFVQSISRGNRDVAHLELAAEVVRVLSRVEVVLPRP